jgi:copper chaperone CopZ
VKTLLLALLAIVPAAAQWESIEMRFEGVGCASCLESLPSRIGRLRGVNNVKVDPAESRVAVTLDAPNRARLQQIRDFIEQDGSKVTSASLVGRGTVAREEGRWTFRPGGDRTAYWLEWSDGVEPPAAGASYRLHGLVKTPRPAAGRVVIDVLDLEPNSADGESVSLDGNRGL